MRFLDSCAWRTKDGRHLHSGHSWRRKDLAQLHKHGQRHAAPGLQQQRVQRYGGLAGLRGCLDINWNITQHGITLFAADIYCLNWTRFELRP